MALLVLVSVWGCSKEEETTTTTKSTTTTTRSSTTTSSGTTTSRRTTTTTTRDPNVELTGKVVNVKPEGVVNIREEPNTDCRILTQAKLGDTFKVLTENYSTNWHQIEYEGGEAYIHKDYFLIEE